MRLDFNHAKIQEKFTRIFLEEDYYLPALEGEWLEEKSSDNKNIKWTHDL
ncbi:hypothetical protein [Pedobacter steynii]|nr:hypothetical protein [Pedobacter steynii]